MYQGGEIAAYLPSESQTQARHDKATSVPAAAQLEHPAINGTKCSKTGLLGELGLAVCADVFGLEKAAWVARLDACAARLMRALRA